jgi:pyruvate dehydrogenase (quinone)
MSTSVSDYLLERLHVWGIRRIYGYPRDGINGIMGALERAGDKFQFIQVRHEEMAAFMACARNSPGKLGLHGHLRTRSDSPA